MVNFIFINFDYIETYRNVGGAVYEIIICRLNVAALPIFVYRLAGLTEPVGTPRLDFYKSDDFVPLGNYIHFAEWGFIIAFENFIALFFEV